MGVLGKNIPVGLHLRRGFISKGNATVVYTQSHVSLGATLWLASCWWWAEGIPTSPRVGMLSRPYL